MASFITFSESISGAQAGQPSKLGYEVRKARKAAAAIPPGVFVCRSTTDYDCKVPTTAAEVLACIGATVLADTIALNDDGNYAAGKRVPIFSKAPGLWVNTIDAAVEGGQVYVNYAGANQKGSVSAAFVSGENIALPGARFGSTQATPAGLVEIEYSCPVSAPSFTGAQQRNLGIVVTYDGSGVPTIAAQAGVSVVDTGTGVFQLVVAGAASVLPLGSPIKLKATPDSSDAPVSVFEVEAIAATSVTFSHRVVQSDATPAGDAADPANGDKIYVGLLVTYA